jgi:hypothetical protein
MGCVAALAGLAAPWSLVAGADPNGGDVTVSFA